MSENAPFVPPDEPEFRVGQVVWLQIHLSYRITAIGRMQGIDEYCYYIIPTIGFRVPNMGFWVLERDLEENPYTPTVEVPYGP